MNDFKHFRGRGRGQYQHNNFRGQNFNNVRRPNPNAFGPLLQVPHFRDKHRWQRPPQHQQHWRGRHQHPPPYRRGPPPGYPPNPLGTMAPRPQSPLPGSEEARQKTIAEASARIKQQLNLTESDTGQNIQNEQIPGSNFTSFSDDNFADDCIIPETEEAPKQEKSVKKRVKKFSESSVAHTSVEELRNKILNQFTTMSKGKITSLVNNPGSSKYDNCLQHLVRDMRLHLSSELRNMYNNRENDSNHSIIDHFNSIVPDLGVELVNLPDTMVAELSKILQFDVNNEVQDCPQTTNINSNDNVLVQPEDMFKEAEKLLLNTDFLESNFEMNPVPDDNISPDSTANFLQNNNIQTEIQNDPFINRSPLCNEPPPNLNDEPEHRSFAFPPIQDQNLTLIGDDVLETADMDIDDLIDENLAADQQQQNLEPAILDHNSSSNLDEIPLPDSNASNQFPEIIKSPVVSRDTSPFSKKLLEANLPDSTNVLEMNFENRQSRTSSIPLFQTQSLSNSPPICEKLEFRAVSLPSNSSNHATMHVSLSNSPFSMRSETSDVINTNTFDKHAGNEEKLVQKFNFDSIWTFKPKIDNITNVTSFLDDVVSQNICDSTKNDIKTNENSHKQIEISRNINKTDKEKFEKSKDIQKSFSKPNFMSKNLNKPKISPKQSRLSLDDRIKMMIRMQQGGNNSKKPLEEPEQQQNAPDNNKQQGLSKTQRKKIRKKQKLEDNKIKVKVQVDHFKNEKNHHKYLNKYQEMISNMPPDPKPDSGKSEQQQFQPLDIVIKQEKVDPDEVTVNRNQSCHQSILQNKNVTASKMKVEQNREMKTKSPPTKAALKDLPPLHLSVRNTVEEDQNTNNTPEETETYSNKKVEYRDIPGVKIKRKETPVTEPDVEEEIINNTVVEQPTAVETVQDEATNETKLEEIQNTTEINETTVVKPTETIENVPNIVDVSEICKINTEKEQDEEAKLDVNSEQTEENQEIKLAEIVPDTSELNSFDVETKFTASDQPQILEKKIEDTLAPIENPEKDKSTQCTTEIGELETPKILEPIISDINNVEEKLKVNKNHALENVQHNKETEPTKKPKADDKKRDKSYEKDRKPERSDSRNDRDRQRHKSKEKDKHKSQNTDKHEVKNDKEKCESNKKEKPEDKSNRSTLKAAKKLEIDQTNLTSEMNLVLDIPASTSSIHQQIALATSTLTTSAELSNHSNHPKILQRLIDIDLQIQKLMSEKFNLYQQLNLSSFNFNTLSFYAPVLPKQIFEDDEEKKIAEKNRKIDNSEAHVDHHHQHHHRTSHNRKDRKRSVTPVEEPKRLRKRKISESSSTKIHENNCELDSESSLKKRVKPDKKSEPKKGKKCSNKAIESAHNSKNANKTLKKNLELEKETKKIEEKPEKHKEKQKNEEIVTIKPIEQPVEQIETEKLERSPKKRRKKPNISTSVISEEFIEESNKKFYVKIKKPEKKHDKLESEIKVDVPALEKQEIDETKLEEPSEKPEKPKSKKIKINQQEYIEDTEEKTNNNRDTSSIEESTEGKQESNNNENKSEYKLKIKHETNEKIKLKIVKSEMKETEEKPNNRKSRRLTEEEPPPPPPNLPTTKSKVLRRKKAKDEDINSEDRSRSRSASKDPEPVEETPTMPPSLSIPKPKISKKKKSKDIEGIRRSRSRSKESETKKKNKEKIDFSDSDDEILINRKKRKVSETEENISIIEEKKSVAKRKRKEEPETLKSEPLSERKVETPKPVPEKLVKNCFVKLERIEINKNVEIIKNNDGEISDSEFHEIIDNIFDKFEGTTDDKSIDTKEITEDKQQEKQMKETKDGDEDKCEINDRNEEKESLEENTLEIDKLEEGVFCTGHHKSILDIKILGNDFLAASEDGTIYKYSLISGELQDAFTGHMRAVTCISVVHGSRVLEPTSTATLMYSGSLDCSLKCFDIDTAEVLDSVKVEQAIQCMDVAWGNIFLGTYEGLLFIYNIKKKLLNDTSLTIANATVLMIKATTEGSRQVLILASRKREIMVRDAFSGLLLRTMCEDQKPTIYSLLLDKSRVYCGTSDKGILTLDFHNGLQTNTFNSGKGVVCMIMYKSLLFAGCYDGLIYVYNTNNNKHITTISGPGEGMLLSLAITDGLIIAGTKKDHLLKIWRIPQDIINQIE